MAGLAADVLIIKEFSEAAINASNSVKDMTLAIGNMSKEFTNFDSNSKALVEAKSKYDALDEASLTLGQTTEQLFEQYKALFDAIKGTTTSTEARGKDPYGFDDCYGELAFNE